jgi:hypothetical protein
LPYRIRKWSTASTLPYARQSSRPTAFFRRRNVIAVGSGTIPVPHWWRTSHSSESNQICQMKTRQSPSGRVGQPLTSWVPQPFARFAKGAGFEVASRTIPDVIFRFLPGDHALILEGFEFLLPLFGFPVSHFTRDSEGQSNAITQKLYQRPVDFHPPSCHATNGGF